MTQIAAIVGSLRKESINRKVLEGLVSLVSDGGNLASSGIVLKEMSIERVPLYNADLDEPEGVAAAKTEIAAADGVLIVTPEYNYGVPGVLKNALDWLSRPAYKSVMFEKPVAILGASPGAVGTARAQGQLKQVLAGLASDIFPYPEVIVNNYASKADEKGRLTDESTLSHLEKFLAQFAKYVQLRAASSLAT